MTLALDYRPRRFADVVGQAHVKPILQAMVRSGKLPPALLFYGSRGTGKTTLARILAAALNCEAPDNGDACTKCDQCLSAYSASSVAVWEIDAASNGGVDDIRAIQEQAGYAVTSSWRVILLDEAHSMSRPAFNALLKTLEQPPAQTLFVLLTTEHGKIPDTVVSRSMSFEFRRITVSDIRDRLDEIATAEKIVTTPELLTEIATRAEGGMRDAVMVLDQLSTVGITDVAGYRDLFGLHDVGVPLFEAALAQDHAGGSKIIESYFAQVGDASGMVTDLVLLSRDLLIITGGAVPPVQAPDELAARRRLAERLTADRLVSVVRVLWELKARTKATDGDQRAQMEMGFVLVADALRPYQTAEDKNAKLVSTTIARMSIDEVRKMLESPH